MFFIAASINADAQYQFESYPGVKLKSYYNWKTYDSEKKVDNTSTVSGFFGNGDEITIQLTSFKEHWWKNSSIRIFQNKKQIGLLNENVAFNPTALDSLRVGDLNNDGLQDVKIVYSYMSNGLGLNCRVIYLLQKPDFSFAEISFEDMMDYGKERRERDFDNDGNFEIITMDLQGYKSHNYWVFNLYNIVDYKLINANHKGNYPIMVPFLFKETFDITKNLTREKMKDFARTLPRDYIAK